jgi:N utilization substance protein B
MALTRSELREKCMIILYQNDIINKNKNDGNIDEIIKENLEIDNDFVKDIVYGVITHFNELDSICNDHMNDWTIDRIDKTGAAILRIAIYELKYTDTPSIVVINEAVELAKKYSDESVRKMIDAVLDKIVKENE